MAIVSMIEAVERALEPLSEAQKSSPLAVGARRLARELDSELIKPSEVATCMREMRAVMAELAKLTPPVEEEDELSRIRREREARRDRAG